MERTPPGLLALALVVLVVGVPIAGAPLAAGAAGNETATPTPTATPTASPTPSPSPTPTPTATATATPTPTPSLDAAWTYSPSQPRAGDTIEFNAGSSTGDIADYWWDFDDDGTYDATGPVARHTYNDSAAHAVTLRVISQDGRSDRETDTVGVLARQATATPTATATATPTVTASPSPTATMTPTATQTATETATATPQQRRSSESQSSGSEWTIDELTEGGTIVEGDVPSLRFEDQSMYWLIYWPPGTGGGPSGDAWKYLTADTTVKRNQVYLRTYSYEDRTVNATVVYWTPDTRTVSDGNATRTERYAANVTVTHQTLDISRGRPTIEIPLRQHDQPVNVLIELDNGARWTFRHHSIATSQPANINTEGDYLRNVLFDFLIIIAPGLFIGGYGVRKALKIAGKGPGWGYWSWIITLTLGTLVALWWSFSGVMAAVVTHPWIVAVYLVLVGILVMLETLDYGVKSVQFMKPTITSVTAPRSDEDESYDMLKFEQQTEQVVDVPNRGRAMLKKGPIKFLARLFGSFAILDTDDTVQTKIEVDGDSGVDEIWFVHPASTTLVDYEAEGFTTAFTRENAFRAGLAAVVSGIVSGLLFAAAGSGAFNVLAAAVTAPLAGAVMFLEPKEASASYWPAPTHMRSVLANMIMLKQGTMDAETFDELVAQNAELNFEPIKKAFGLLESQADAVNDGLEDVYADYRPGDENGHRPGEEIVDEDDDETDEVPADD